MTDVVLVTGATGTVGRHVAPVLADHDAAVRLGVRDPDAISSALAQAGEPIAFDFTKPETWGRVLDDVDGIFLLRPPTVDAADVGAFVEAADRVGIPRLAYLSTLGADKNPLIPHHWIEKRIAATELDYTLLRASFFMQNLLEVHGADILEHDEIFVPAGGGKTSFVDARDVAAVAAVVLTEPGHSTQAYDLTGANALDYDEVAAIFSDVLDRTITYPEPSLMAFARRMRHRGESLPFVAVMCAVYTTARLGLAARISDDCRRLLGREPRSMRTFVEDYAAEFEAATAAP